jgi:serine/threonine protein kinase
VHRDIKSGNVMLTSDLHCKLIDFGLSQLKEKLDTIIATRTKTTAGSVLWMAPEIVNPDDDEGISYNKATDVYALGITLWEIAARKLPYLGTKGNMGRVVMMKVQGKHDEIPSDTPACVAQAIERCRSIEAAQRPSAAQLVDLLH